MDFLTGSQISVEESKFEVIYELRKLLATEFQVTTEQEFEMSSEQSSFHIIGYCKIYFILVEFLLLICCCYEFSG